MGRWSATYLLVGTVLLAILPDFSGAALPPAIAAMSQSELLRPYKAQKVGTFWRFCYVKDGEVGVIKIDTALDQAAVVDSTDIDYCRPGNGCGSCHAGG